jgi:hypothetical protein
MTGKSRKWPAKEYDVKFYVTWHQNRRVFDIKRDGVPTGTFSSDKTTAIGLAIAHAKRVAEQGNSACVYAYSQDGNRAVKWDSLGLDTGTTRQSHND